MGSSTTKPLRPFHETVIQMIRNASSDDLGCIAILLKSTRIPKNHDAIIVAWKEKRDEIRFFDSEDFGVTESILEQKRIAESDAASESKKERALMIVIQKIIACYQNYNAGDLDDEIFKLFEKAKRIHYAETDTELQAAIADL